MKFKLIYSVAIIPAFFLINTFEVFAQTTPDENIYVTPVKSCHFVTSYASKNDSGQIVPNGINFQSKIVYDQLGREIQQTYYTWQGDNFSAVELIHEIIYENGKEIRGLSYDSNYVMHEWFSWTYDPFGNKTSLTKYTSDSIEINSTHWGYSESNLVIYETRVEGGLTLDSVSNEYNLNGQVIKSYYYTNGSKEPSRCVELSYHESTGKLTSTLVKSGTEMMKFTYNYTDSTSSISTYYGKNKYPSQIQYFDNDSNEVKVINFISNGKEGTVIDREFNDNGKVKFEKVVSPSGEQSIIYTYDEHGNLIEQKTSVNSDTYVVRWTYNYDSKNNWIQCIEYSPLGTAQHISTRFLTYY